MLSKQTQLFKNFIKGPRALVANRNQRKCLMIQSTNFNKTQSFSNSRLVIDDRKQALRNNFRIPLPKPQFSQTSFANNHKQIKFEQNPRIRLPKLSKKRRSFSNRNSLRDSNNSNYRTFHPQNASKCITLFNHMPLTSSSKGYSK